ncbi:MULTISPECIES: DUF3888 domain-containing protein [Parageobacillus]|uniref:DUF3888 domain-containing protein n=1 Tax=Parageobacillus galactosidasius TaxID=883812 RepID=A0A226QGX1_9BACL|nr:MULTISPECIES: DUF3888 domain-containing protein [Parageobacillus]MED4968786.1 DUF3888 domain-containing protein [Parageobacillus toebii]OXB91565.1 hypothetical protein B9L23_09410 [Parageobacillus galactosidasius]
MKRILISLVICLLFWNLSLSYQVVAKTNITGEEKHTDFYDALLVLLDPYARKAINNEYPSRSYGLWNAEILEVNRKTEGYSQYDFTIKVKYDTYTGPHNPPEGPVILTFDVKLDRVTVTKVEG